MLPLFDGVCSLVDKSLLQQVDGPYGEPRFTMLETIGEFGGEGLIASGEAEAIRRSHAEFFLMLAEQAEAELHGPEQRRWLDRLEVEHDNLRAALRWSQGAGDGATALRFGAALWRFWWLRGYWSEGRERLHEILALPQAAARTRARARALCGAGHMADLIDEYALACSLNEESVAIFRELDDQEGIALALGYLGLPVFFQGGFALARSLWEESVHLWRQVGNSWGIAEVLSHLGWVTLDIGDYVTSRSLLEESCAIERRAGNHEGLGRSLGWLGFVHLAQGEFRAARSLFEESLALQRELGNQHWVAIALTGMGSVSAAEGDEAQARSLFEESLAISRTLGDRGRIAWTLNRLANVDLRQGSISEARARFMESLALRRELSKKGIIAECMEGLASVAGAEGEPERAGRLFGAAAALRDSVGLLLPPADRAENERRVAAARAALGEEAFAAAWAEGRAMLVEQAVSYALAETPDL